MDTTLRRHPLLLKRSPLDRSGPLPVPQIVPEVLDDENWKPSRFNFQTTSSDGHLVVWNTFSRSITAFAPGNRDRINGFLKGGGFTAKRAGIVDYLAKRGLVIGESVNELRRVQQVFGAQQYRTDTLQLILLASEDCNFRCKYCYEKFAHGTMKPKVRQGVKKLVEQRAQQLRELRISWFGGEPLYGFAAIEDLGPYFVDMAAQHGFKLRGHMTTNGFLLTDDVVTKLLAWDVTDFQITLDGPAETHDCSRPTREGEGTFDVIFHNLCEMAKRPDDFTVVVRVNFDRGNSPALPAFIELLERHFKDDPRFLLSFHAVGKWGGENDADLDVCGKDMSREVQATMKAAAKAKGLNIAGSFSSSMAPGSQVCYAARPFNFIIGATGKVMKCTVKLDASDFNVVGLLDSDGDLNLDQDKMALWTEPAFEQDSGCRSCAMVSTCNGMHCPLIRIEQNRRPCPSSKYTAKHDLLAELGLGEVAQESETAP